MKFSLGMLLAVTVLLAPSLFAQSPCWGVCQAYYPCDYPCDLCVGDPGLWEGSYCWGEIVSATCGDIGQCGYVPCNPEWIYDDPGTYQGATPEIYWDPYCQWVFINGDWQYVCDYSHPWKCSVYDVYRYSRHQNNCPSPPPQTFCASGYPQVVGYYSYPSADWECCADSNRWNCGYYFPNCPGY